MDDIFLNNLFLENNWYPVKKEQNHLYYTKLGDETSYFDIQFLDNSILVSVPIKNSIYQYITKFKYYNEAKNFVIHKLTDYI
jgi:hypothetical protein